MKNIEKEKKQFLFKKYNETRTVFLDNSDEEKLNWFKFYYEKVYKKYFYSVSKDAKILDLGCNKGYLLKTLENQGFTNLTGVDLSAGDLVIAKKIVPIAHFIEKDIFDFLNSTKDLFDVICLKAVIEHVEKAKVIDLLKLMSSKLTSNGLVLIDVYNADWLFTTHDRYMDFTHETGFTKESLNQVMICAFNNVLIEPIVSPINFSVYKPIYASWKKEFLYKFFRKIVFFIINTIEPEMEGTPFMERTLIGIGKNN